jgi:hypothetical protein
MITSNLLHSSLWPGLNFSSHLTRRPFARRSAISVMDNSLVVGVLMDAGGAAEVTELINMEIGAGDYGARVKWSDD